jgi:ATP-dependent helicase/nuclease subunit A
MGQGTLTIYSASAGSGKTYNLTAIYLTHLFRSRLKYRNILAVTFTNKATAEMKSRILEHLYILSSDGKSEYLPGLIQSTGQTEAWIREEAGEILNSILHDYSRFSVSTIDSFFQKVLRAFAREIGLHSGFSIELDHSIILSDAIDAVISSVTQDEQLKKWLLSYAMANIEEEKSWNLKEGIVKLAEELFKENFKILSLEEQSRLADKKFLTTYIEKIRSIVDTFEKKLVEFGTKADEICTLYNVSDDLFYRKGMGVPGFIRNLKAGNIKPPNSYVREILAQTPRWATNAVAPELQSALNNGLGSILPEAINYWDANIKSYSSASCILLHVYALGILSDVLHNVHQITTSENTFLLSDAGELLNRITAEDQSPFIYEKVGNRFENFMIDEFQDTSIIQWENFKPLIENSMAEGFDNLVVGDVKQSIYRWRNSDWRILGRVLEGSVDNKRIFSKPLATNWRSRSNIISFNNALFTVIPELIDATFADVTLPVSFRKLYSEAVQTDPGRSRDGYVRLEFILNTPEKKWQEVVLDRLPEVIESLQDKGYKSSDIGIIVRDGREGASVLNRLIEYSNSCNPAKKEKYNYNAVSNDSLLLSNSPVIIFIVSVLSAADNPDDFISRAIMLRYFLMASGRSEAATVSLKADSIRETSLKYYPDGFVEFFDSIRQMPLFEATENIIRFFSLGDYSWNVPFLNTFQDYVVSFTGNKNGDISTFLEWWEETGKKKSVVLPGNHDALRILTIHKSKGLEFGVVILPFLAWNLDHIASKQPYLWVKPVSPPFNELGIVPVKYSSVLADTIFSEAYMEEKYSVYLDNINLLYVALTRAKDVMYMFSADGPRLESTVAGVLKKAFTTDHITTKDKTTILKEHFDTDNAIFEFGNIADCTDTEIPDREFITSTYHVSRKMDSLKLKLHGENYFSSESQAVRKKINYGKIMHEVFEGINTLSDVSVAVRRLVLEGKLTAGESPEIEKQVLEAVQLSGVSDWFSADNDVLTEAGILLPDGVTRRPDRIIFRNGKTTIIDFKFGEEKSHYIDQISRYRALLKEMGYENIDGYIWYVDKYKIVSV